ncbi:MAG TPA: cytochrome c3 family protein, partial [Planctomycetota bacterium]|nr:cytochrome c3 family protein [Planctomycetota bacterium]
PSAPLAFALALAALAARGAEPPKELVPKAPCINATCHAGFPQKKEVHGPVAAGECASCHVWKDNKHEFKLARKGTALCTECHDDLIFAKDKPKEAEKGKQALGPEKGKEESSSEKGKEEPKAARKQVVHEPVRDDCATCHDPHGGDTTKMLTAGVVKLCETCHDEVVAKARAKTSRSVHSVVLEGKACMSCHKPHVSDFAKLLKAKPMDACLSCHDRTLTVAAAGPAGAEPATRTIPSIKEQLTARKHVHPPMEDKDCGLCHTAHASSHVSLLLEEYPPGFYAPFDLKSYALCLQCHEKKPFTEEKTKVATGFRNGTLNLHYLHVNKPVKGRTCRACHASHASDQPLQIRDAVPFGRGGWMLPVRFEQTKTGGSCASGCHVPRAYDREHPVDYTAPAAPPKGEAPPPPKGAPEELPKETPKESLKEPPKESPKQGAPKGEPVSPK